MTDSSPKKDGVKPSTLLEKAGIFIRSGQQPINPPSAPVATNKIPEPPSGSGTRGKG